jgi:hypothetical protein
VLYLINAPDSSETRHASGVLFALRMSFFMFLDGKFGSYFSLHQEFNRAGAVGSIGSWYGMTHHGV